MELTFAPNGHLQIDDAVLVYKNFSGRGDKFNREGDMNFSVRLYDEAMVQALVNDTNKFGIGWNVKVKPPREDGDDPFMHLPVKVKFTDRGPTVYLISGDNRVELDEGSIGCLDNIEIERVDLDIRPYDGEVNGKPFRTAYVDKLYVTQRYNRFIDRYGF